jgi:menaquinone-dependent protoporphyrinogen oxidase
MSVKSRRWFLTALAGAAALGAATKVATWRPAPTLVASICQGGTPMDGKILVAYATRTGSTAEVAEAIAKRLCATGLSAEVRPVSDLADLSGYSGAVLGSAIRYAAWLPEMIDFLTAHRDKLAAMPVVFFTMHMLALGADPTATAERAKYTAKAKELVAPMDEVFFAGKIDPARLSFVDRILVRLVKSPTGDKRDWPAIRAWADTLAARLA